jgi:probable rRNA maturation factor
MDKTVPSAWPDSKKRIQSAIQKVVQTIHKIHHFEISLLLINDLEIQKVNHLSRGKDKPTDVLSFPISEHIPGAYKNLGEILISMDTLKRQAKEIGHSQKEEFYRLLVHGILHLLGYDHEISPQEEKRMKRKEDQCLELIWNVETK